MVASTASASTCGKKVVGFRNMLRIFGGKDTKHGSWPWQASLISSSTGRHFCGGSLIYPEWVLSAAHCIDSHSDPSSLKIKLGEHVRSTEESSEQLFNVSKIIGHENYTVGGQFFNDVALIKLSRPAKLNKFVNLVCLPAKGEEQKEGTICHTSGWGELESGALSNTLQDISGPIWRFADCKDAWKMPDLDPKTICFGNKHGEDYGACRGDSGGPLSCKSGGKWKVVGITHLVAKKPLCRIIPGRFQKVEPYLDWIQGKIGQNTAK